MLATARKLATRHSCLYRGTVTMCSKGAGKGPRKCKGCGGPITTATGLYGVFVWRGDGRYPEADAVKTFTVESRAETFTEADSRYVVRWISLDA